LVTRGTEIGAILRNPPIVAAAAQRLLDLCQVLLLRQNICPDMTYTAPSLGLSPAYLSFRCPIVL
jgi:hypothetical protein